jgi:hypothetical protein
MNCNECGSPMTELDPREITDPQPSRFIPRWRCDEKECPRAGGGGGGCHLARR